MKLTYLGVPAWLTLLSALGISNVCISAWATEKPDWVVTGESQKWPKSTYIIGIGTGKDIESAAARARKAIAESIVTQIKSKYSQTTNSKQSASLTGKVEGTDEAVTEGSLDLESNLELQGATNLSTYTDPDDKTVFVLAGMSRLATKNRYASEALKIRNQVLTKFGAFQKDGSGDISELITLQKKYEAISYLYSTVSEGNSLPEALSGIQLEEVLGAKRKNIDKSTLTLSESEGPYSLKSELGACLTQNKFTLLIDSDDKPKFKIESKISATPEHMNVEGWVKMNFKYSGQVILEGKSTRPFSFSKTETGRTIELCFEKVKEYLVEKTCNNIVDITQH